MNLLTNDCMRLIVFEDIKLSANLGVLANDREFFDITAILPEFPEKLHDIVALKNAKTILAEALYYEDMFFNIGSVKLKAPLCSERYLWLYAENNGRKGLCLQAVRGVLGHGDVLRTPFNAGFKFVPYVVFMADSIISKAAPKDVAENLRTFTLLNLGMAVAGEDKVWSGMAGQFEGLSAAGPWLMLCKRCYDFFSGKTLDVIRNKQHIARINLGGITQKAAEVMAGISRALTVMPGDMLALPVYPAVEAALGDSLTLNVDGFGALHNVVGGL